MIERPRPPRDFALSRVAFVPAPELDAWARATFIDPGSPLYNEEHAHLGDASILWLWARDERKRQGNRVLGDASIPRPPQGADAWTKAAYFDQVAAWYSQQWIGQAAGDGVPGRQNLTPGELPDFIVRLWAPHAEECADAEFCYLTEHELHHCAQAEDEYGAPRFHRDSGLPVWAIRGHDAELFVSDVERYGAATPGLQRLRAALLQPPTVGRVSIAAACGTCGAA